MKSILVIAFFILISCNFKQEQKAINNDITNQQSVLLENKKDSLFELDIILEENFVQIKAPKDLDFTLPDSNAKIELYKTRDFNADNKEDVMVYLGACGTGGCMYGIFINEYENYYKLAFMDYLKGAEFKKEKNGLLSITSYEEASPYNPSKLHVTKFKFDKKSYQYQLDTTYIYIDN